MHFKDLKMTTQWLKLVALHLYYVIIKLALLVVINNYSVINKTQLISTTKKFTDAFCVCVCVCVCVKCRVVWRKSKVFFFKCQDK